VKFINPAGFTPSVGVALPTKNAMTTNTNPATAAGVNRSCDLFTDEAGEKSITQQHTELEPHVRATNSLERLLQAGHTLLLTYSGGKGIGTCDNKAYI